MELKLLEKTELLIENVELSQVNLNQVAATVATVLGLNPRDVTVIDVRSGIIALDILRTTILLEQIVGKENELLSALNLVTGLTVTKETRIHSEGVLGLVNLSEDKASPVSYDVNKIVAQIHDTVQFRAIIFPTGEELIKKEIEDTNTPFLVNLLKRYGYMVTRGKPIKDSFDKVTDGLRRASEMGYGLVITTGGVGAEDKDHIVDAILAIDPKAATPYVVHYTAGQGRHKKDGVRIAVGKLDWTTFISLPGPHNEVQLLAPTLMRGLREHWNKGVLANQLAIILRANLTASFGRLHT